MPAGAQEGTCTTSGGAAIAFTRRAVPGAGAPRIVLIHSLALDRSVWDAVVPIECPGPIAAALLELLRGGA